MSAETTLSYRKNYAQYSNESKKGFLHAAGREVNNNNRRNEGNKIINA